MRFISNVINDNKLNAISKQIGVEIICLDSDLNWFENEMKNSLDVRSTILHDIFHKLE